MRLLSAACATLVVCTACTATPRTFPAGFRKLEKGAVITYRVDVSQTRTASGLGPPKSLKTTAVLNIEEEVTGEATYAVVVRSAQARGEESQRLAANRLVGRRIDVDVRKPTPSTALAFSGTPDVATTDVAMLFVLLAPVLPSPRSKPGTQWRKTADPASVTWAQGPLQFTVDNRITGIGTFHELESASVASTALSNVTFHLPMVVPAPSAPASSSSSSGPRKMIVNELFEQLFSNVHDPITGVAAVIAAIPLAIFAPFIAIGEAIAGLFGGKSRPQQAAQPAPPVVDLVGPLRMRSDTKVWTHDGRVLDAAGTGTTTIAGQIPTLPGRAASLSGKTLHLDASWKLKRTLTSPFPKPPKTDRVWPLAAAAVLVVIAAMLALIDVFRKRP